MEVKTMTIWKAKTEDGYIKIYRDKDLIAAASDYGSKKFKNLEFMDIKYIKANKTRIKTLNVLSDAGYRESSINDRM